MQQPLFAEIPDYPSNIYRPYLTAVVNAKGVLDVDTVKGCTFGMAAYPHGGCYGECYAYKTAYRYGMDFARAVSRKLFKSNKADVYFIVKNHHAGWFRVGTSGDPSHDWGNTIDVLQFLKRAHKIPVIVTKHWATLSDEQLEMLRDLSVVVNTSISSLDTDTELAHRIEQIGRIRYAGIKSVARVVTCSFGETAWGKERKEKQNYLLSFRPVIDTPLRATKANKYVKRGDILITKKEDSTGGGGRFISLHGDSVYLGTCGGCPDQCGADHAMKKEQ